MFLWDEPPWETERTSGKKKKKACHRTARQREAQVEARTERGGGQLVRGNKAAKQKVIPFPHPTSEIWIDINPLQPHWVRVYH